MVKLKVRVRFRVRVRFFVFRIEKKARSLSDLPSSSVPWMTSNNEPILLTLSMDGKASQHHVRFVLKATRIPDISGA